MAMQDVFNKMKGTALGVAEYLTPVLKVKDVEFVTLVYISCVGMRGQHFANDINIVLVSVIVNRVKLNIF